MVALIAARGAAARTAGAAPAASAGALIVTYLHFILQEARTMFLEEAKAGAFFDAVANLRTAFSEIDALLSSPVTPFPLSPSGNRSLKKFREEVGLDSEGNVNFENLQTKKRVAAFFRRNRVAGVTLLPFNFYGQEVYDVGVVTGGMMSMYNYGFGGTPEDEIVPRSPVFLLPTSSTCNHLLPSNHMVDSELGTRKIVNILATVNEAHIDLVCAGLPTTWARDLKRSSFLGVSNSSGPIGLGSIIDVHVGGSIGGIGSF